MEIALSGTALRTAHLLTRVEIIHAKHMYSYDCIICDDGGHSIYAAFRLNGKEAKSLEKERQEFIDKWGTNEKIEAHFKERQKKLLSENPLLEKLSGVWRDLFEMLREEGIEDYFIKKCQEYFQKAPYAHRGCYFTESGREGWFYTAAQIQAAKNR